MMKIWIADIWNPYELFMSRLSRLRKNRKIVIPRAVFARGICFFPLFAKKQIPRFARDDN
jgi:hypothetical protein